MLFKINHKSKGKNNKEKGLRHKWKAMINNTLIN